MKETTAKCSFYAASADQTSFQLGVQVRSCDMKQCPRYYWVLFHY